MLGTEGVTPDDQDLQCREVLAQVCSNSQLDHFCAFLAKYARYHGCQSSWEKPHPLQLPDSSETARRCPVRVSCLVASSIPERDLEDVILAVACYLHLKYYDKIQLCIRTGNLPSTKVRLFDK